MRHEGTLKPWCSNSISTSIGALQCNMVHHWTCMNMQYPAWMVINSVKNQQVSAIQDVGSIYQLFASGGYWIRDLPWILCQLTQSAWWTFQPTSTGLAILQGFLFKHGALEVCPNCQIETGSPEQRKTQNTFLLRWRLHVLEKKHICFLLSLKQYMFPIKPVYQFLIVCLLKPCLTCRPMAAAFKASARLNIGKLCRSTRAALELEVTMDGADPLPSGVFPDQEKHSFGPRSIWLVCPLQFLSFNTRRSLITDCSEAFRIEYVVPVQSLVSYCDWKDQPFEFQVATFPWELYPSKIGLWLCTHKSSTL